MNCGSEKRTLPPFAVVPCSATLSAGTSLDQYSIAAVSHIQFFVTITKSFPLALVILYGACEFQRCANGSCDAVGWHAIGSSEVLDVIAFLAVLACPRGRYIANLAPDHHLPNVVLQHEIVAALRAAC